MRTIFFWAVVAALFSSCGISEDLARGRADKFFNEHPGEFAQRCADKYPPVVDSIGEPHIGSIIAAVDSNYIRSVDSLRQMLALLGSSGEVDTSAINAELRRIRAHMSAMLDRVNNRPPDTIPKYYPVYQESTKLAAERAAMTDRAITAEIRTKELQQDNERLKGAAKARLWGLIAIASVAGLGLIGWLARSFKTFNIKTNGQN